MDHHVAPSAPESPATSRQELSSLETSAPAAAHPVLSRLMEEVRNGRNVEASYDRVHNRHNRGQ